MDSSTTSSSSSSSQLLPLPVSSPSHSPSPAAATASPEERAISVESPCDLYPGFVFVAKIGVEQFCVTVPSPGVRKGEIFQIRVPATSAASPSSTTDAPRSPEGSLPRSGGGHTTPPSHGVEKDGDDVPGQWKDGIFDCFRHGVFHPSVWNAMCCPHILMRQVSNRLGGATLSSLEAGSNKDLPSTTADTTTPKTATNNSNTSYRNGTTLFVAACLIDFLLVAPLLESSATAAAAAASQARYHREGAGSGASSDTPFFVLFGGGDDSVVGSLAMQLGYGLWTIALTVLALWSALQLRAAVKARYNILRVATTPTTTPRTCCKGTTVSPVCDSEDVLCVTCCHPCALAQVARQTTDYDVETAACCTIDGMAGSPRLSVCLLL